jgi:hypothetical protein
LERNILWIRLPSLLFSISCALNDYEIEKSYLLNYLPNGPRSLNTLRQDISERACDSTSIVEASVLLLLSYPVDRKSQS